MSLFSVPNMCKIGIPVNKLSFKWWTMQIVPLPVADPGFPEEGATIGKVGTYILFGLILHKNMKHEETWTQRGTSMAPPPPDLSMVTMLKVEI